MSSRGKVVLLTGSHLCNNPRGVKEADALDAAGFEVEVLGWIADPAMREEDRGMLASRRWTFTPCVDWLGGRAGSRLRRLGWRAGRRLAFALAGTAGVQTAAQLGGWRQAFLQAARQRQADLYIAHSAAMIWVALELRSEGRTVGVDMEDWFSQENPAPYPSSLVMRMEGELLRASAHATCTSREMSGALSSAYACAPPLVIYNAFPWSERERLDGLRKDRTGSACPSLHWYSQTLGAGRGLEDLFAALPMVKGELEIHLRGGAGAGTRAWINAQIPPDWRERVHVHAPVANAELMSRIAEHDIGFAGEAPHHPSRDLTVTNKMLQYLLAGLAVIASDTRGQREIAESARDAVLLYRSGDSASLARRINGLLAERHLLQSARRAALLAAQSHLCWERTAPRLVASVVHAVNSRSIHNGAPYR